MRWKGSNYRFFCLEISSNVKHLFYLLSFFTLYMRAHGFVLSMLSGSFCGDERRFLSGARPSFAPQASPRFPFRGVLNSAGLFAIFGGPSSHSPLIGPGCDSVHDSVPCGSAGGGVCRSPMAPRAVSAARGHGLFCLTPFDMGFGSGVMPEITCCGRVSLRPPSAAALFSQCRVAKDA